MHVRLEEPEDHAAIHALHKACFPSDGEARLVDALRAAGRLALSLVAEVEGQVVAQVAFSPVTLAGAKKGLGLAPVATLVAFRRQGIADALIRRGLELCRTRSHAFVVVLGDPAYYGRFGFEAARKWGLQDEYGGGDAFQAQELVPGALAGREVADGLVRYAPEFANLE